MKKGLLLLTVLTFGVLLASCKKDPPPLVENPNLIFNPKGVQALNIDQGPETTPFTVNILRTMGKDKAITVNLAVDATKLPAGKTLLDAKYYTIDKTAVPMASGAGSASFTVTFKSELMFDEITDDAEWDDYAVAIALSSVSPEFPVVADDTFVVINATMRGSTIISEGADDLFAEVSPSGENATVELLAKANFTADAAKVSYTVDEAGVAAYNTENETELTLLPSSAYSVGTGVWSTTEEDTDDDPDTDPVEVDVISNTITINKSVAAGIYLLPLKITTSEEGVEVEQTKPIYILVESVPAAVTAQVTNGDFSAPLPYMMQYVDWAHSYGVEDIMAGAPGVWKHKYEWLSPNIPDEVPPSVAAVASTTIVTGGGSDGSDCLLIDCSVGTFDYPLTQKIIGLDPTKMYTLSAKVKITDVTNTGKSGGVSLGYWPKGNTANEARNASYGTAYKNFTGAWGDVSCLINNINDNGEVLIVIRFGGNSADTDGKAYIDDVKIEEYIPEVTGELVNGDFETEVGTSVTALGTGDAAVTASVASLVPGEWKVYHCWWLGTPTYEATEGRNNSKCMKIVAPTGGSMDGGVVQKIIGLTPNDVYTFSAWIKCEGADKDPSASYPQDQGGRVVWFKEKDNGVISVRCTYGEGTASEVSIRDTTDWTQVSMDVTVPASGEVTVGVRLGGNNADTNGTFWIDDATFVKK